MWQVYEKKLLLKAIQKIPAYILKHYEVWKQIVELEGPQGLRLITGYHDEALKGQWKGFRSSRLTQGWHIIYKVEDKKFEIYVIDVNHHDYRK